MNFGKNCGIRIIADDSVNFFGTVREYRDGNKLIIEVAQTIIGQKISRNTLLLKPLNSEETFTSLLQYYGLRVKVYILDTQIGETEFLFNGIAAID